MDIPVKKIEKNPEEPYKNLFAFPETGKVSLYKDRKYHFFVSFRLESSVTCLTICVSDSGAGPNSFRADVLNPNWLDNIHQLDLADIRSASDSNLKVSGTVTRQLRIGKARTRINSSVVSDLAVSVLLATTYINKFIMRMHLVERYTIPYQPQLVPILIVNNDEREAEMKKSGACQEVKKDSALLVTPTKRDPK